MYVGHTDGVDNPQQHRATAAHAGSQWRSSQEPGLTMQPQLVGRNASPTLHRGIGSRAAVASVVRGRGGDRRQWRALENLGPKHSHTRAKQVQGSNFTAPGCQASSHTHTEEEEDGKH
eukprot:scaffold910_cov396-Prasinococcus_capsulatus_cf.AAC.62